MYICSRALSRRLNDENEIHEMELKLKRSVNVVAVARSKNKKFRPAKLALGYVEASDEKRAIACTTVEKKTTRMSQERKP